MAVSSTPARPETPTPRTGTRRARGEGQWALGHREPLNPNERTKKDDDPLNVRARIENIYAHRRLRLDRPRRPARPVPLVGPLHPAQGRHRRRAYRRAGAARARGRVLHAPGPGRRRPAQPGPAADHRRRSPGEFARDTADITDRQNIQLHWIRVEDVPEIWRRLEAVGLQTTEACGDCPRIVLGSPVAGVAEDEVLDPTPAIDEIVRRYVGDKEFSNLPRKFKTSISWLADTPYEANDISFLGVRAPRARPRLRPLGRRRAVHQPDAGPAARRLGAAGRGAGRLGRRGRHLPRLRLPPAAQPGPAEVPGRRLGRGEVPRGAGEGVPGPGACSTARRRSCRTSRSTTSACTSSATARNYVGRRAGGGPGLRHPARPAGRRRRGARQRPGTAHPVPEAAGPRRRAGADRVAGRRGCAGSAWRPGRRPGGAARWPAPASSTASSPSSRPRRAAQELVARLEERLRRLRRRHLHPPQRLPERLRPHPGRRHRPQGPAGGRARTAARSRASRCTSAAAWAWPRARPPASAASCAA